MDTEHYKPGLGKNQGLVHQLREFQRNPRSLIFVSLAESYRQEGLPHQALEILDEGLGHHPGLASAVVARARCLFDLKRYAEALAETQLALRNNGQNLKAHKLQAEIYVRLGQRKAAMRSLSQVLSLYPQDSEAARSLEELESLEKRQNAPAERSPRPASAPVSLGRIEDFQVGSLAESMAQVGQKEEAEAKKALHSKPTVAYDAGALKPSLAEKPRDSELTLATRPLAEHYLQAGMVEKARQVLAELARNPADQWARETLQDLSSDGIVLPAQPHPRKRSESLKKKARALERMLAAVRLMKPMGA